MVEELTKPSEEIEAVVIFTPEAVEKRFNEVKALYIGRPVSPYIDTLDPDWKLKVNGKVYGINAYYEKAHEYFYTPLAPEKIPAGKERITRIIGISDINEETWDKCHIDMDEYDVCLLGEDGKEMIVKRYSFQISTGDSKDFPKSGNAENFSIEKQQKVANILGIEFENNT